ncbi:MAG: hypothetical protein A2667_01920 [Candidatus Wildermuthbacteria bacterium RIFCSPHIGHO2_01_FULL_47_27]|uniref:UMP kinase n=2 Tax=Candidatus Wildermuthiibacteriota TaxID=1817923 RepID=A0A1G2RQ36_9BACT|nr:MAG: hypothetical protein A2667_01920 [Candidatus Wildermuthbacteria bacterium RIFCSPHIGHO2_01_FULL_47_27]OHA74479.1 MAG: hypothetical protein A3A32_00805 [Candidatus Wildermuthbacteria bacterium RIFCSPLOWO2_01_FULL_48_35]
MGKPNGAFIIILANATMPLMARRQNNKIIIALGGSIIMSAKGEINIFFLKKFRKFILGFVKQRRHFVVVTGGGTTARAYQKAARKIARLSHEDMDWLGIHATRINAHLLRTIFRDKAYPTILDDPHKPVKTTRPIIIAAGWRPGWSTDYIAVLLAKRFKVKQIIDAGNIPFVFTKDHKKYKNAKPIKSITWQKYQKLIDSSWTPGMPAPIDPIAAKEARRSNINAVIIDGKNLKNFRKVLLEQRYVGTFIGNGQTRLRLASAKASADRQDYGEAKKVEIF